MVLAGAVTSCTNYRASQTSPATVPDSIMVMLEDCQRMKKDVESRNEAIQKLTADVQRLNESLAYVEQHFVAGDPNDVFRADATSARDALSRAESRYDQIVQAEPGAAALEGIAVARARIDTSKRLIRERRYAQSFYFSTRAMDAIEDRHSPKNVRMIAVSRANVRRGPGTNYDVVAQLAAGTLLFEVGGLESWYRVETVDGLAGWVHESVTTPR